MNSRNAKTLFLDFLKLNKCPYYTRCGPGSKRDEFEGAGDGEDNSATCHTSSYLSCPDYSINLRGEREKTPIVKTVEGKV